MFNCPVCGKQCKTQLALNGHIRLKSDVAHERYRGYPTSQRIRKPTPKQRVKLQPVDDTDQDLFLELQQQNIQLKQQIAQLQHQQQQPAPVRQAPVQQAPVEQALDNLKQERDDLKTEQELIKELKKEMDGGVTHDHDIMDRAPKTIRDELWKYHLRHDFDNDEDEED